MMQNYSVQFIFTFSHQKKYVKNLMYSECKLLSVFAYLRDIEIACFQERFSQDRFKIKR
jgi:hypothetical protein